MIDFKSLPSRSTSLISVALMLMGLLSVGCGGHPVTGTTLVSSIKVTADSSTINAGGTTQLHAMSTSSAGQTTDVTSTVAWSSGSPTIAAVSTSGALTGMSAGNATITASLSGVSGLYTASIGTPAVTSLVLKPGNAVVFTKGQQKYDAVATYANGTQGNASLVSTWSVTPASVATVDQTGLVTGIAPGSFSVTAVSGTQTATTTSTVTNAPVTSIAVTPANPTLAGGTTQKFTATATYADGTTADVSKNFNWASSNTALLTIDANGLATVIGTSGMVTVTGQFGTTAALTTVTLKSSATLTGLVVTPTSSSIANGSAEPHVATATYSDGSQKDVTNSVTWSVVAGTTSSVGHASAVHAQGRALQGEAAMDSMSPVVAVDQTGVDWAMEPGITTVQASMGGLQSQSVVIVTAATVTSLAITSSKTLFPAGSMQPMQLVGHFSDGTTQDLSLTANWKSSDSTVATIDSKGNATGVKAGTVTFTASFQGLSASTADFTVLPSNLLYTTVRAYATAAPIGIGEQLQVIGTYSDGTVQDLTSLATWKSANPNVDSVESSGFVHPLAAGTTEVTATVLGRSSSISLAVIDTTPTIFGAQPEATAFPLGTTNDFVAGATFANGISSETSTVSVWTSSDPTVLTIDSNGKAKAGKVGTATVTATLLGITATSVPVQVTNAKISRLLVSPNTLQIGATTSQQYKAIGFFSDATVLQINDDATWSTEDITVASIDGSGVLLAIKPGKTHVVCTFGDKTVRYPVTVTAAKLQTVRVVPENTELPIGVGRQFSLMGTFTDGTVQDLTADAVWSTNTPSIITVLGQGIVLGSNLPGVGSVSAQIGFLAASTSVNVTNASLTSVSISPLDTTIREGSLQPLSFTGTFSDGFTQSLDLGDSFTSSVESVAKVLGTDDTAYGVGVGTTKITGTFGVLSASTNSFRVLSDVIASISITPANPSVVSGGNQQFQATATYADGTTGDISGSATWASSNPAALNLDSNGLATGGAITTAVTVTVTAASGGATASLTVSVSPTGTTVPTLSSLAVTPSTASIASGTRQQFTLTGTYSDGSTQDLTPSATWTSSVTDVATISPSGWAFGFATGTVQFSAAFGGLTATTGAITVTPGKTVAALLVKPSSSSIAAGSAEQHSAFATYSDGTQSDVTQNVTWSVVPVAASSAAHSGLTAQARAVHALDDSSTVVAINQAGVDTAMTPGLTTVQANLGSMQSQSVVIVTPATVTGISIFSSHAVFPAGTTQQLQLVGTFSDGSYQDLSLTANWQSSNSAVATIDQTGLAKGVGAGAVTYTASFGGLTASTQGFQVLPLGLVSTTLNALYPAPLTGTCEQLKLIGTYVDGSTHELGSLATWSSANPKLLTVDSTGMACAVPYDAATVTVTATQVTATVLGQTSVIGLATVFDPVVAVNVYPQPAKFALGTRLPLEALTQVQNGVFLDLTPDASWIVADPTVFTIDANGLAKSGKIGKTTVNATVLGVTGTSMPIEVTNATIKRLLIVAKTTGLTAPTQIAAGTGMLYQAIGFFSDGNSQDLSQDVVWTTSDSSIAAIGATGIVQGIKPGQVQVTASFGGQTVSVPLTVTNATLLSTGLSPNNIELPIGTKRTFSFLGNFSDGTTQDLSYDAIFSTPTPSIIAYLGVGQAIGAGPGQGAVSAQRGYFTASTPVNVKLTFVTSIAMNPANSSMRLGSSEVINAIGTFDDGYSMNLVDNAIFSTSTPQVLGVLQTGRALTVGLGSGTVAASFEGSSAIANIQVQSGTLTSLNVTPANPSLLLGATQQLTATGTYSDGTTGDVTAATTWVSSNSRLVSIDGNGVATALSLLGLAGRGGLSPLSNTSATSVPATASSGGQSKTFNVTVLPSTVTLSSVAVSPSSASFAKGTTQQFTLTGTYSDGSTQNLTSSATWTTTAASVGTISSAGLATGVSVGSVQFTGSYGGKTSTTGTVSVTPATLVSLAVTPSSPSFAKGTTQQFHVTGTYTDGSTQDLTGSSTYASSNTGVVSVTSGGLATGTGTGSAQVTITSGGQTVTTGTVSVTPTTLSSIVVNPTSTHAAAGTTVQLTVTGTYTDGSTADVTSSAMWMSSNTSLATVTTTGLVTGVSMGLPNITAQVGSQTAASAIRVSAATLVSVAISPSGASFAAGASQKFTLTGTFSDGSTQDLSSSANWSTSNSAVATVSGTGLASGAAAGSVQFTASYGGQTATTPTVTVTPATLVSIAVTPSSPSFAKGTDQQFHVVGTYSDGTMHDLTGSATFTSSNPAVVSISGSGLGQGLGAGSVQITVAAGGQTASTQTVTVTPATLTSVVITPNSPSLADGTTQQFTATGTFSDGTTEDLSGQAVWTSSNAQVMTIGQTGLGSTFQVGGVQVSATIDGITVMSGVISVTPATLASISVTPTAVQIAKGTVRQMTATGTYTDGSTQNLSSMVTWSTSDGTVVTINASGLATGTGIGSATLTASLQGKTASTNTFQVSAATLVSIAFNPAHPTVAAGSSSQVSVIGTFSDGSTQDISSMAMYSSSNTAVATVSSTGVVAGVAPGTSTVTVQANGVTNSFNVTVSNATLVSIAITPANPAALAKGTTQQFMATGTYSDGTTQNLSSSVAWTSSNTSVFSVDQNGLATGTGVGSGQLMAAYQGQTASTPSFQVTPATVSSLAITPGNVSLVAGSTQQYTATATYTDNTTQDVSGTATWSSSNQSVATINSTGFANAVAAGNAVLQAQYQGLAGKSHVTVTSSSPTLQQLVVAPAGSTTNGVRSNAFRTGGSNPNATAGGTEQFTATAVYSDQSTQDVTTQALWSSSNTAIATVNASTGLASLLAAGSTSIQAQYSGLTGSVQVTVASQAVLQSIAISPSSASVAKGLTQQFTATGTYSDGSTQNLTTMVSWQSSNTAYATINASGLAQSTTGGQTQISAIYQGQTAQVMLTVSAATLTSLALTPSAVNLANGTKQQLIATGTLSDGSTQDFTTSVTWTSNNTSNATVNASGFVSTLSVGSVTITAQAGSINASASVNVTAATATSVQLTPSSVTIPVGGVQQFQATAMFTDGTSQDVTNSVTYTTSNAGVVTVDANGKLHGVGTGTATVTATTGSASTTTTVNITMVALNSIAITPANLSLADGLSQQLTATGTFADGSTQNLTNTVTWTSSNPQVVSVSSTGKVTMIGIGTVTITATTDNISATDQVTATAATVSAISVTPASTTLAAGQTQQFAATATFTDGSQQTVTSSANWSVSDPSKGSISNSGSTKGFLTSSAAGTLNVVATINGTSGMVPVTVQPAALTVLRITPSPISAPAGTTQQLTVTGSYTDGSTANVTASTTWTSGSASVATVDTSGLLHAITAGSTSVQAMVQNTTTTASVMVGAAALSSIALTPSASSLAKGLTQQMTAIGTYTDGSTANITSQVQWSSSAPSVATVSGTGLVSTLSVGHSTLMATLNSVSQTASLTVTAAVLQSIAVTASQNSFALGLSLQLTATGTYSDGTTQDLTNSVTWTSSASTVGMVNATGLASGMTTGTFTARAAAGSVIGSLPLTVTAAVLQSIVVTPANQVIVNVGGTTQFTATGHFSDGTTQNLTNSVHWTLTGPVNVGTISQTGQLSGVHVGVAGTVTATSGMIAGSTGFTVVGI